MWRQENPVFHSSCKLELGIALQSLQGKIDLIYACVHHFHALEKEMATRSSFLPGESQGQWSLMGCRLWGRTESDMTEAWAQSTCPELSAQGLVPLRPSRGGEVSTVEI